MECREICIRATWSFDGAKTLTDAATRLRDYASDLEGLAALGFDLRDEIEDDYGFGGRPTAAGRPYPRMMRTRKQNGRRITPAAVVRNKW